MDISMQAEIERLNLLSQKISVANEFLLLNGEGEKQLISRGYVLQHIIGLTPEEIAANKPIWGHG